MIEKLKEKEKAVSLRKQGFTYSEILKQIPVAKSSLSLWLHSVGLAKKQTQKLTEKKRKAMLRGAEARRTQRIDRVNEIKKEIQKDPQLKLLNSHSLWLTGVLLYWAEGSKEKDHNIGTGIIFSNSDPRMIRLFMKWLKEVVHVPKKDIKPELYIHKTGNAEKAIDYWSEVIGYDKSELRVYLKRNSINTNRKNIGENYFGGLRLRVSKSSTLNRKITAWTEEICKHWGVV